ncbi:MAG: ATP-binding protein [Phaeodactylibacter sp.]|nr:ATP-binding protein [Phaeodactylibacter sp.]MCB9274541.1 ATP-binding protein [Lewinellaceae bacterium]
MHRILFTGPESTGKSEMARLLAEKYDTRWVPEYAREYLEQLGRPYEEADLLHIAQGQLALESRLAPHANRLLFVDTSMLVMKVWSEYKYGRCHPWILEQLHRRRYSLYALCGIDIPWAPDPQRENPNERQELYEIYRRELQVLGVSFIELWGSREQRLEQMHEAIKGLNG